MGANTDHVNAQLIIRSASGKDSMVSFEKKGDTSNSYKMGLKDSTSNFVIER
jgi:hypothetical protein